MQGAFEQLKPLFYLDYLRLHAQARAEGIVSRDRKMLDPATAQDAKTGYRATINRLFRSCLENLFTADYFGIEKLRSNSYRHSFVIRCKNDQATSFRSDIKEGASAYLSCEDEQEQLKVREVLTNRNIPIGNLLFSSGLSRRIDTFDVTQLQAIANGTGAITPRIQCEFNRGNGFLKLDAESRMTTRGASSYSVTHETFNQVKDLRKLLSALGEIGRWFRLRAEEEAKGTRIVVEESETVNRAITIGDGTSATTVNISTSAPTPPARLSRTAQIEIIRRDLFDTLPQEERPPRDMQVRWAEQKYASDQLRQRRAG